MLQIEKTLPLPSLHYNKTMTDSKPAKTPQTTGKDGQQPQHDDAPKVGEEAANYGVSERANLAQQSDQNVGVPDHLDRYASKAQLVKTQAQVATNTTEIGKIVADVKDLTQEQKMTNQQMANTSGQIDYMKEQFDKLATKDLLESKFNHLVSLIQAQSGRLDKHEQRFDKLEQSIDGRFDKQRREMFYLIGGLGAVMIAGFGIMATLMVSLS